MNNLTIWDKAKAVPDSAKKEITAGKLKGFTDINPTWRAKRLTEIFGPVGIGWYPEITRQWLEEKEGVTCAFCNINLYVKVDGEWSKPIPGTGGNQLAYQTRNGASVSDEAFKMAYTDAISVSAKLLGIGADVYWDADKYQTTPERENADGQKIVSYYDAKELSNAMIKAYGSRPAAFEKLQKFSSSGTLTGITYDEFNWVKEQFERDTSLVEPVVHPWVPENENQV